MQGEVESNDLIYLVRRIFKVGILIIYLKCNSDLWNKCKKGSGELIPYLLLLLTYVCYCFE